jgi:HD-GYP domain-containing protein (c-di-GMP phosphodiesterase class II)
LTQIAPLIRAAREHFEGTGYPDGLVGDAAPLGSRIIAICAAVVAMTSDLPYGPALNVDQVIAELRRCAGTQFDPLVATALVEHLTTATMSERK